MLSSMIWGIVRVVELVRRLTGSRQALNQTQTAICSVSICGIMLNDTETCLLDAPLSHYGRALLAPS